jgi:type IV secretory pathway component VirB8
MGQKQDLENQEKWSATMDRTAHVKTYKSFLYVCVIVGVVIAAVLVFMVAFLT